MPDTPPAASALDVAVTDEVEELLAPCGLVRLSEEPAEMAPVAQPAPDPASVATDAAPRAATSRACDHVRRTFTTLPPLRARRRLTLASPFYFADELYSSASGRSDRLDGTFLIRDHK
ncbi:MAG: hypothetical protein ABSC94_04735 [Polyangiaceae bacterium]|jgi:hypothetical protein